MARRRPPNRLGAIAAPGHLFVAGVLVIVCFLLQQNLVLRIVQVALYAALAVAAGKRIRWAYFVIMVASITVFNLFTPIGEVLLRLGPVTVTRGALMQGLLKGFAIPGLVFISLFAVQPTLELPGRLGGLVARLFYYFERLLDGRGKIKLRGFVASVDGVLLDLDREESEPESSQPAATRTSTLGFSILGALILLNLAPLIYAVLSAGLPD